MLKARYSMMAAVFLVAVSGLTQMASAQYGGPQARGAASPTVAARAQLQVAQANVDQIKAAALRTLDSRAAWVAAKRAASEAGDRLESAKEQARTGSHQCREFADLGVKLKTAGSESQKVDIRASMTALEAAAIIGSADVKKDRATKSEADAAVLRIWDTYEADVLVRDPRWLSAVAARDQARVELIAASATNVSSRGDGAVRSTAGYASWRGSSGRSSGSRGRRY